MSALSQAAVDYVALRRGIGFKLENLDRWLSEFTSFVEAHGGRVTVELAMAWAAGSCSSQHQVAQRLSAVRLFARYLQASSPETEVPPAGLVPFHGRRKVPYLYSAADFEAMMEVAGRLCPALRAATTGTTIGLLAVTGMRIGEVLALDCRDISSSDSAITVRVGKFNKERLVPMSESTLSALYDYLEQRRRLCLRPEVAALLVNANRTRLAYPAFLKSFHAVARAAGIPPVARIHDIRHSFAVATLLDWYRKGVDVQAYLPRLSAYLGHIDPTAGSGTG